MADVHVYSPGGEYGTVPEVDLAAALGRGYVQATPADVRRRKLEAKYGGAGGALKAAAAGFARGVLPAPDVAAVAIGGEETRRALAGLKEVYPTVSGAAEIAGFVGSAIASGPAGAAKIAAKVGAKATGRATAAALAKKALAYTPAAEVARIGRAAEAGAQSLLGHGLAGKAAGIAAREGTEGAAYGASAYANQAALAGQEISGEQLALSALQGAKLGAGVGLGIGGAGWGLRALSRGASRAARETTGALAKLKGVDDKLARELAGSGPESAAAREALRQAEKHADFADLAAEMSAPLGQLRTAAEKVGREFKGGSKAAKMNVLIEEGTPSAAAIQMTRAAYKDLDVFLDGVEASFRGAKGKKRAPQKLAEMRRAIEWRIDRIDGMKRRGRYDMGQVYMDADSMKRAIKLPGRKYSQFVDPVRRQYQHFETMLEDTDLWGQAAGSAQRDINKSWWRLIGAMTYGPNRGAFRRGFKDYDAVTGTLEAFDDVFEAKVGNLAALLKKGDDLGAAQEREGLRQLIEGARDFSGNIAKHSKGVASGVRKQAAEIAEAATRVDAILTKADSRARVLHVAEGLRAQTGGVIGGAVMGAAADFMISAAGGAMGGGLAIGLLRGAKGVGADSYIRSRMLAEQLAAGIPRQIARGVKKIAKEARSGATKSVVVNEDYLKARKQVESGTVVKRAAAVAELSGDQLPASTRVMLERAQVAQDYLLRHLPTASSDLSIPSRSEIDRFERIAKGALDPMSLLRDIAGGKVSSDTAKAVKDVWPATYDRMRSQLAGMVLDLWAEKKELPYREALALASAFDIAAHKTLEPSVVALQQAAYSAAPEPQRSPPPRSKPLEVSGDYRTASERLQGA